MPRVSRTSKKREPYAHKLDGDCIEITETDSVKSAIASPASPGLSRLPVLPILLVPSRYALGALNRQSPIRLDMEIETMHVRGQ